MTVKKLLTIHPFTLQIIGKYTWSYGYNIDHGFVLPCPRSFIYKISFTKSGHLYNLIVQLDTLRSWIWCGNLCRMSAIRLYSAIVRVLEPLVSKNMGMKYFAVLTPTNLLLYHWISERNCSVLCANATHSHFSKMLQF